LKTLELQNKTKTLKIHQSKASPPPPFTRKKENEDPQNDKKKIENPQTLKKQKIPQSYIMNFFFENKYQNKNRWLEQSQGRQKRRPK
jgi:hypothetical protein